MEILPIAIILTLNIKGTQIEETQFKLSQYADDTTLTLTRDGYLPPLQRTTTHNEQATGEKVHPRKCKGLWLGNNRMRIDSFGGYEWLDDDKKLLGLHIGHRDLSELNWKPRIESYTKTLKAKRIVCRHSHRWKFFWSGKSTSIHQNIIMYMKAGLRSRS